MLVDVEASHVLGTRQRHAHLTLLLVLVSVLFFKFANLGVLTALDLSLVHDLVVVLLVVIATFLCSLFASLSPFLIVPLAPVLIATFAGAFSRSSGLVGAFASSVLASLLVVSGTLVAIVNVLSGFLADLHDCDWLLNLRAIICLHTNHRLLRFEHFFNY